MYKPAILTDMHAICASTKRHMSTGRKALEESDYLAFKSIHGKKETIKYPHEYYRNLCSFTVGENVGQLNI